MRRPARRGAARHSTARLSSARRGPAACRGRAPCRTLSTRRGCCGPSAPSVRRAASATRTWCWRGRRSRCRRTSWRPPVPTSGTAAAAARPAAPPAGRRSRERARGPPSPPRAATRREAALRGAAAAGRGGYVRSGFGFSSGGECGAAGGAERAGPGLPCPPRGCPPSPGVRLSAPLRAAARPAPAIPAPPPPPRHPPGQRSSALHQTAASSQVWKDV